MKYAFMSFSAPRADARGLVELARAHGYAGIEPRVGSGHAHGLELGAPDRVLRDAARIAADAGVAVCCVATGIRLVSEPRPLDTVPAALVAHATLARTLGAPLIRVFGGKLPQGMSRGSAVDTAAAVLARAAPDLARLAVTAVMETHDDWCDPADVVAVLERVASPAAAANWDVMHPVRTAGWSVEASYRALAPWIRHVHVHDGLTGETLEFRPMGEGAIDHRTAIRLLRDGGYDGFASGEWIDWQAPEVHLPREIATLRSYE